MGKAIVAIMLGLTVFGISANLHKADATENYRVDNAVVTQVSDTTEANRRVEFMTSDGNIWVVYRNDLNKGNEIQVWFDTCQTREITDDVPRQIIKQ